MHDLAHLAVRRSDLPALLAVGEKLTEAHAALLVHAVAEGSAAQGFCEGRKKEGCGGFVVPHMGAVAEAASGLVVAALKAMKLAVGGAEAGGGGERGEVGAGCFLHDIGYCALRKGAGKGAGAGFETDEIGDRVLSGIPGALEAGGIEVADDGIGLAFGRIPAAPAGGAIGKMP